MDIISAYQYYLILQNIYFGYSILSYSYKVYKTGKYIKKYYYKEKITDDEWVILDLLL
jgi:hypothetical protein